MPAAAKPSFAFRLGRSLGHVAKFCLHDRNPNTRWVKRVVFVGPLLFLVISNITGILSTILTAVCLVAGIYALSKIDSDKIDFFAEDASDEDDHDESHRAPFYGEYGHPNYHMYYDD